MLLVLIIDSERPVKPLGQSNIRMGQGNTSEIANLDSFPGNDSLDGNIEVLRGLAP